MKRERNSQRIWTRMKRRFRTCLRTFRDKVLAILQWSDQGSMDSSPSSSRGSKGCWCRMGQQLARTQVHLCQTQAWKEDLISHRPKFAFLPPALEVAHSCISLLLPMTQIKKHIHLATQAVQGIF